MTDQAFAPAEAGLELAPDAIRLAAGDPLFAEERYPDPPADGDSDQVFLDESEQ